MEPNAYIKKVRAYPLASHKAWEEKDKKSVLKLDWNESDVRVPLRIRKAVMHFVMHGPLNWYPDIANKTLVHSIARYVKVSDAYVQYFVGEDCALDYTVRTFVSPGDEVALMAPTYDNFRVFVESVGAVPKFIFGRDIFHPDLSAFARDISPRTKMVYMVNPNNPTGVQYSVKEIEQLLKSFPSILFFIDEAYAEFSGITAIPLVKKYSNIIVGRSFSKAFGLASFRLGYLVTDPRNLVHINKIRNGKSISALGQIAAIAALEDSVYVKEYVKEVRRARAFMCKELSKLGFQAQETPGNFILLRVPDTAAFCAGLAKKKAFVRGLGHLPSMEGYVRVTVGNMKTTKKFLSIVQDLLKHGELRRA